MVAPLVAALSALGRAAAVYAAADALRWTPAAARFAAVALIVAAIPSHLLAHHGGGGGGSRRQPAMGTVAAARELRNAVWLRGGVFAAGLYAFCCALRRCHNPLRAVILDGTISHVFAPWFAAAPHIHEGGGGGGGSARGAFWRRGGCVMIALAPMVLVGARDAHALAEVALLSAAALMVVSQRSTPRLVREAGGPWRLFARTIRAAAVACAPLVLCEWCLLRDAPPPQPLERDGRLNGGDAGDAGNGTMVRWLLQATVFGLLGLLAGAARSAVQPMARGKAQGVGPSVAAGLGASFAGACLLDAWRPAGGVSAHPAQHHALGRHEVAAEILLQAGTALLFVCGRAAGGGHGGAAHLLPLSLAQAAKGALTDGPPHAPLLAVRAAARRQSVDLAAAAARALHIACASRASARLAGFLAANAAFMLVEGVVGVLSRSLTLTTDAAHMLLDCAAIGVGLYGETAARWQSDEAHPFGFARYDALCALINGVLLLLVALSVSGEALCRLMSPPLIDDERLLPVAFGGLCVNLVGLAFFHDLHHPTHHQQQGEDGCGCAQTHGASPAGQNVRGVFLHVVADTMGSVATIASTLLARHLGWRLADPLCSLLVAGLITASALPLLRDSASLLLLRTPEPFVAAGGRRACIAALCTLPHIRGVPRCHVWSHTHSRAEAIIAVLAAPEANERLVVDAVERTMRSFGVHSVAVEVQKDTPTFAASSTQSADGDDKFAARDEYVRSVADRMGISL